MGPELVLRVAMRYRAVILDDNSTILKVLWSFFDRLGYEVFSFPEPRLCPLHLLHACPCPAFTHCADVVVSDLHMGDGSGIDFLEQLIQKGCQRPHFALMSGGFSDEDFARASRLGCTLFSKPLDMAQFAKWVEDVERSVPSKRILCDWLQKCPPQGYVSSRPSPAVPVRW